MNKSDALIDVQNIMHSAIECCSTSIKYVFHTSVGKETKSANIFIKKLKAALRSGLDRLSSFLVDITEKTGEGFREVNMNAENYFNYVQEDF